MDTASKVITLESLMETHTELQTEINNAIISMIEKHKKVVPATSEVQRIAKLQIELERLDRIIFYNV